MSERRRPIRVLMVDVDGVLVHGRPADGRAVFSELKRDMGLGYEQLRARFFNRHWEAIVTGREPLLPQLSEALAEIAPQVGAGELVRYWFDNDARTRPEDLMALDEARRRGLRVHLATNQEHLRAADLMERVGLGRHVDGMV